MPASEPSGRVSWREASALILWGLAFALVMYTAFRPGAPACFLHYGVLLAPIFAGVAVRWPIGRARAVGFWFALGTLPFWAAQHWFLNSIAVIGGPALALALAVHVWIQVGVTRWIMARWPSLPFPLVMAITWTANDFWRGRIGFDGYPWYYVAHPLIDSWLAQAASSVGVFGVTFLAVWLAVSVWRAAALVTYKGVFASRRGNIVQVVLASLIWLGLIGASQLEQAGSDGAASSPGLSMRVAVVQTSMPQAVKMQADTLDDLRLLDTLLARTREATAAKPDVIVWPETMFPGDALDKSSLRALDEQKILSLIRLRPADAQRELDGLPHLQGLRTFPFTPPSRDPQASADEITAMWATEPALLTLRTHRELGIPMLIGGPGYEGLHFDERATPDWKAMHNSVHLLSGGTIDDARYDKMHLTPFGEVMPYISLWPWLERQCMRLGVGAGGMKFNLSPGTRYERFNIASRASGPIAIITPICFEATMSNICRRLAMGEPGDTPAQLMILPTNDGWFFDWDAGREEHLRLARWRCVELGLPMIRAANTGVSCHIDAKGRVLARGVVGDAYGHRVEGIAVYDVSAAPPSRRTIFSRIGDAVGWWSLAGTMALMLLAGLRKPTASAH